MYQDLSFVLPLENEKERNQVGFHSSESSRAPQKGYPIADVHGDEDLAIDDESPIEIWSRDRLAKGPWGVLIS